MNKLFSELQAISKEGSSVVVKIDGERWSNIPPSPFTVLIFGGRLITPFRMDSDNLVKAIETGILFYKENSNYCKGGNRGG